MVARRSSLGIKDDVDVIDDLRKELASLKVETNHQLYHQSLEYDRLEKFILEFAETLRSDASNDSKIEALRDLTNQLVPEDLKT